MSVSETEKIKKWAVMHEFKAKYLPRLALLNATSERENELRNNLVRSLTKLRATTLPNFLMQLNNIINKENVSQEFKEICREMVKELEERIRQWGS